MSRSLLELLEPPEGSERDPAALAVHGRAPDGAEQELSWAELRAEVDSFAHRLRVAGLGPGEPVAVRAGGVDVVVAAFGTWAAGGVFVPINPRSSAAERDRILGKVSPAVYVDACERSVAEAGSARRENTEGPGTELLADPATHDADVALITFTSGTTGPPEPVLQRHSGVLDMFEPVLAGIRGAEGARASLASPTDRPPMPNLVPVPLTLWAGLYNVLFAFRVGAPAVLLEPFSTEGFAKLVRRFGIRSTVLPPAAMVMLSDDEAISSLEPLRYVRSITAPLSPLQARRFRDRFGVVVLNGYGQTEFGGEIAGWSARDARQYADTHLGAVGRVHAGVEVQIRSASGVPVAQGQEGELWVRTPAIAAAVEAGTAPSGRVDSEGWLRSGDIARLDADGFLWIEGRVSDAINRGGLKVHPGEVEEVLRLAPTVADVAVLGVPDERLGEVPWAYVVPARHDVEPQAGELEALCREQLAPYKVPVRFVTVGELPRNEVGKVLRHRLRSGQRGSGPVNDSGDVDAAGQGAESPP